MKKIVYALLTLCAATAAHAEIYTGTYLQLEGNCEEPSDSSFSISTSAVGEYETYCEITRVTNVERMDAVILDTTCSAEGEDIGARRYFIASTTTFEGPGVTVYAASEGNSGGWGAIYKLCSNHQQ